MMEREDFYNVTITASKQVTEKAVRWMREEVAACLDDNQRKLAEEAYEKAMAKVSDLYVMITDEAERKFNQPSL